MAFDTYMAFLDSTGSPVAGESQVAVNTSNESPIGKDLKPGFVFEIDDFSFDIEQVLNIGSQSSGLGSGKVTLNAFSITRKTDRISPMLFALCCTGEHFQQVSLYLRRAGGMGGQAGLSQATSGMTFLRFDFALVGVATIEWSGADGDEACKEAVTFKYGALQVRYVQQGVDGKPLGTQAGLPVASWNSINNNAVYPPNGKLIAT
jgi:type VI secretion system Hcp family effector